MMGTPMWSTESPKYPGYYWAISQHGEIDFVRVRPFVNWSVTNVGPLFSYTFGDTCTTDPIRWTHWMPLVPPDRPQTLPAPPVKKAMSPKEAEDKFRGLLEDVIRQHKPPLEAKFQMFTAGEGETVSETVVLGEGMTVIDGVAVTSGPAAYVDCKTEDEKDATLFGIHVTSASTDKSRKKADQEAGWSLFHNTQLDELGKLAQGRSDMPAADLISFAKQLASQVARLGEEGQAWALRRLRAVNPTMLCLVRSYLNAKTAKEGPALPRP